MQNTAFATDWIAKAKTSKYTKKYASASLQKSQEYQSITSQFDLRNKNKNLRQSLCNFRIQYACQYKPRLIHFLPHFWKLFLCFHGGLYQKIMSLCMTSIQEFLIKSGLWWRPYCSSLVNAFWQDKCLKPNCSWKAIML